MKGRARTRTRTRKRERKRKKTLAGSPGPRRAEQRQGVRERSWSTEDEGQTPHEIPALPPWNYGMYWATLPRAAGLSQITVALALV